MKKIITSVGELKEILKPFIDECKISPITIEYLFNKDEAFLKIKTMTLIKTEYIK